MGELVESATEVDALTVGTQLEEIEPEIQSTMEVDAPERGPQLKEVEPEIQSTTEVDAPERGIQLKGIEPEIQSTLEANAVEGWVRLKKADPNTPSTVEVTNDQLRAPKLPLEQGWGSISWFARAACCCRSRDRDPRIYFDCPTPAPAELDIP